MLMPDFIRKHGSSIVIGSIGWIVISIYLYSEFLEYGNISQLIEHVTEFSFYHSALFSLVPLMMIIGYLYDSKKKMALKMKSIAKAKTFELVESEKKFRGLAEESPNMIFINKGERVVYANKKCEEIMGYTREELYSPDFDFMVLIAPESRDLVKENLKKHGRGEEIPPYEYELRTKIGSKIIGLHATKLIDFEGGKAILGIITDVTEHRKADQKLLEKLRNTQLGGK
jgi:PAS domain S-box-containing protein